MLNFFLYLSNFCVNETRKSYIRKRKIDENYNFIENTFYEFKTLPQTFE
jgi:hypothetical protein